MSVSADTVLNTVIPSLICIEKTVRAEYKMANTPHKAGSRVLLCVCVCSVCQYIQYVCMRTHGSLTSALSKALLERHPASFSVVDCGLQTGLLVKTDGWIHVTDEGRCRGRDDGHIWWVRQKDVQCGRRWVVRQQVRGVGCTYASLRGLKTGWNELSHTRGYGENAKSIMEIEKK